MSPEIDDTYEVTFLRSSGGFENGPKVAKVQVRPSTVESAVEFIEDTYDDLMSILAVDKILPDSKVQCKCCGSIVPESQIDYNAVRFN